MGPSRHATRVAAHGIALLAGWLGSGGALAQTQGCALTTLTDPPRQEFRCRDGLTISAERDAAVRFTDSNRDGRPEAADLTGRGVLVEAPSRRGAFQIRTPHAIASVRGTVWAVDVSATRTSVFVAEGQVEVTRATGDEGVRLNAGDGVDVEAGAGPLTVNRWGDIRAKMFLGRFGR